MACGKRVKAVENPPFDWSQTQSELRERLGSDVVDRWLEPLRISSVSDEQVVLEAPNQFFRDWVASHYLETLRQYSGSRAVQVVVATASTSSVPAAAALRPPPEESGPPGPGPDASSSRSWDGGLNRKFTLERFVVGPSNRFAHAASLAVAESPARAYNPLFIYGGVGMGKTHLMQAIGHAILQRWPDRRVVYLSSEQFANELILAIQVRQTPRFRERYRTVDVLLVDDIHFIAGKEATQEEFFHTFNTLYDAHKQIIMSSDRSPKDIPGLEDRLVSRFEWGLVTDIQPPDLETRTAIVRKKAEESNVEVPDAVTAFIAEQISSNIRELEGALIRVIAYCDFFNKPRTVETAQEVLKDMVREVSSRVTIDMVQERVAEYFRVELREIRGIKRQRSILFPRQIAMYLSRRLTDASLPEIGRAFGGRDHTTVLHAVDKIEREITQDPHKRAAVDRLQELVVEASRR
ncbi:MAG TPA: chromosomal replication initiator protein DnaA [bacterium]